TEAPPAITVSLRRRAWGPAASADPHPAPAPAPSGGVEAVSTSGARAVVAALEEAGVEVVFGLCGDTSLPFYDALAGSGRIRHVLTRDERSAAYMADAYARLGGRVGVCEGPSGGGATYIVPGVAEADGSSVPLVCLTSDVGLADRGRGTLTEMDQ